MPFSFSKIKDTLFSDKVTIPPFLDVKYIPSLDGLRAFAILFVLMAHVNFELNNQHIAGIFMGGVLGVRVFFAISGFLITTLLLKEKVITKGISLKKFYTRRFLRILPVYLLAILVIFILDQVFSLHIATRFFVYVLTFTENFDAEKHWYTRHFWSLSVEEQFYLLFPFIIKKSLKFYIKLALFLIVLTPIITILAFHQQSIHSAVANQAIAYTFQFLSPGLISILIGSLAAVILFKFPLNTSLNIKYLSIIQAAAVFLIWFFDKNGSFISGTIRDFLISSFLISTICFSNSVFYKLLNTPVLKTIGVLSYSIYIWQQLFVSKQPWAGSFPHAGSLWVNLPALFIVSYLSYHYFEKPFLKLKTKFSAVKSQPVADL